MHVEAKQKVLRLGLTSSLSMTSLQVKSLIMPSTATRPATSEHVPYYTRYIELVSGDNVMAALKSQVRDTIAFLNRIPAEKSLSRYAPGKWSVREVLGHMIDTERVFAYRALRIGRGDATPLAGFEQDDYIKGAAFDSVGWKSLIEEFEAVRRANILMFSGFTDDAWTRSGTANKSPITVRAIAWIIAGHELHHRKVIEENYLVRT